VQSANEFTNVAEASTKEGHPAVLYQLAAITCSGRRTFCKPQAVRSCHSQPFPCRFLSYQNLQVRSPFAPTASKFIASIPAVSVVLDCTMQCIHCHIDKVADGLSSTNQSHVRPGSTFQRRGATDVAGLWRPIADCLVLRLDLTEGEAHLQLA
jgi:hypothetical protein